LAAERKFTDAELRDVRATGKSLTDIGAHFGVATSTISRRLRSIDAEDYVKGRRQAKAKPAEGDDRTTPPLPGSLAQYDVYAGLLTNLKRAEEMLGKDLSHQERVRVMSQVRANIESLIRLQASTVREDAAKLLVEDVLAAMAEMDDETRAKFESFLRRRRDLRRALPGD
jgi:hypothetical protein